MKVLIIVLCLLFMVGCNAVRNDDGLVGGDGWDIRWLADQCEEQYQE